MKKAQIKRMRPMSKMVASYLSGKYRLDVLMNGRWSTLIYGTTYDRATSFARYYPNTRIILKDE